MFRIKDKGNSDLGLAFHTMCLIYMKVRKKEDEVKKIGAHLFCFGGKTKANILSNKMKFTEINRMTHNFKWQIITPHGIPPSPRYAHIMHHFQKMKYIAIFGGKNKMNDVLNDLNIFQINAQTWTKVIDYGETLPIPRCSHLSFMKGNKMFVLGGVN